MADMVILKHNRRGLKGGGSMNILEQLEDPGFRPSKSDRMLMQYIRANAQQVPHLSIARMAEAAGVGESTITRFAKKMGFVSLQAFKVALAEEVTQRSNRYIINNSINREESALVTGRKLLDTNIGALEKTLQLLPEHRVEQCADLIMKSRRLRFVGLGNSGFIARDAAYRFYRIGLDSIGMDNSHEMFIMAALATKEDVILGVSQSGRSREVLETLQAGKANGAVVILITADPESPMAEVADACLVYDAKESLLETGSIAVKMAQFFVLDLLYTQVVKAMGDTAIENKRKTAQAFRMTEQP